MNGGTAPQLRVVEGAAKEVPYFERLAIGQLGMVVLFVSLSAGFLASIAGYVVVRLNNQGWTNSFDLNSVAYGTSPAFSLHSQHPSGEQYADYLSWLAESSGLRVKLSTEFIDSEWLPALAIYGKCMIA